MIVHVGPYRLNLAALVARMIYRWHWRIGAGVVASLLGLGLATGVIPPVWRDQAQLVVQAPVGATILVDEQPWPRPLYAGRHTVRATLPDGRSSWAEVTLDAAEPLTLRLPVGLAPPRVRAVPPGAPGTSIDRVWWADGGWRVHSRALPQPTPVQRGTGAPTPRPVPLPAQTVALTIDAIEPLPTLDAYDGKADVVHVADRRFEAFFYPAAAQYGRSEGGTLEVRGWDNAVRTIPISHTLTLVRWAPTGDALLLSAKIADQAEELRVVRPGRPPEPVVAIPGVLREVYWSPTGKGAVLLSEHAQRLTLTLIRLAPGIAARVIGEMALPEEPSQPRLGLVPLHWTADGVEWLAPAGGEQTVLWRAPLRSLIPERVQALDAVAVTRLPDGVLRVVTLRDGQVLLGRQHGAVFVAEAVLPDLPVTAELVGQWSPGGDHLLLQAGVHAWLVEVEPPAPGTAQRMREQVDPAPARPLSHMAPAEPSFQ